MGVFLRSPSKFVCLALKVQFRPHFIKKFERVQEVMIYFYGKKSYEEKAERLCPILKKIVLHKLKDLTTTPENRLKPSNCFQPVDIY